MAFKGWPKVTITTDSGERKPAIAPLIVSASRATDIPAFFGEWFMRRLDEGYIRWVNPWSGKPLYVSFEAARLIVFWSKNPASFLPNLDELDRRGLHYYFHFTLNDYELEGLEPGVPPLQERVETFKRLSERIGRERVLWRFDPLLLTDTLSADRLLERIERVGSAIEGCTGRLTISFITCYAKVSRNLRNAGINLRNVDEAMRQTLLRGIADLGRSWKIPVVACAEERDWSAYGIGCGGCIDGELIARRFGEDQKLMALFGGDRAGRERGEAFISSKESSLKDKGQRPFCGCIVSRDIGGYNTCRHCCIYCYANASSS